MTSETITKEQIDNRKYETNRFYYYANIYRQKSTSDEELQGIDMTDEFWNEIEEEIKADELVDININAKVRIGKSTVGIHIGKKVFYLLLKHAKRKEGSFGINNIARDEQEYSKMMRDPKTGFTVIVTDEINALDSTGENTTVEQALNSNWSNVQAGRYVHRICCSPKGVTDENADIFLEVIAVDKVNKITHH